MIIKRQKLYATSVYTSQSGSYGGSDFAWENGSQTRVNKLSNEGADFIRNPGKRKFKKTASGGEIHVGKDGMVLHFHEGLDQKGRKISQDFVSTKDPVSAYRDFLRGNSERMAQGDIFGTSGRTLTNQEIKDAIRKNARKQAIISKTKKAAPYAITGTALVGTAVGIRAFRKKERK